LTFAARGGGVQGGGGGRVGRQERHFAVRIATTSLASQREQLELLIKLKPMLSDR
jgi:hypothetical protein